MSPIVEHFLPVELLAHVFTIARAASHGVPHKLPCEVIVSHVSRRWREVALTTPTLWTHIAFYTPKSKGRVDTYLQRSGCRLPLTILIDVYDWDKRTLSQHAAKSLFAAQIYGQLSGNLFRVRKFSILCRRIETALILQNQFNDTAAPMLESFSVDFHTADTFFGPVTHQIFTGGLPKLTYVDTPFIDMLALSELRNVTTLVLHLQDTTLSYPDLASILTSPNSLVNLSIKGMSNTLNSTWPIASPHPDQRLTLSKLNSLRILGNGVLAVRMLLSISAPKLESLWLDCPFDSFQSFFAAPQMANPKFPALKYLTLREYNLRNVDNFAFTFPSITHLHLLHPQFFHAENLVTALSTSWRSLHSLIFTLAREAGWQKFSIAIASIFPDRSEAGYPINLLLDKDFRKKMEEWIPDILDLTTVIDLNVDTYQEPWWSNRVADPLKDYF